MGGRPACKNSSEAPSPSQRRNTHGTHKRSRTLSSTCGNGIDRVERHRARRRLLVVTLLDLPNETDHPQGKTDQGAEGCCVGLGVITRPVDQVTDPRKHQRESGQLRTQSHETKHSLPVPGIGGRLFSSPTGGFLGSPRGRFPQLVARGLFLGWCARVPLGQNPSPATSALNASIRDASIVGRVQTRRSPQRNVV